MKTNKKDFIEDMKKIDPNAFGKNKCQKFCNWIQNMKNKILFWKN